MHALVTMVRPSDAHFFRDVIGVLEQFDHDVTVLARDDPALVHLLRAQDVDFDVLGPAARSGPAGLVDQVRFEFRLLGKVGDLQPDVVTGVSGVAAAHVGAVLDVQSVVFADAETAPEPWLVRRFVDGVHTPAGLRSSFGLAHRRYEGFHALSYLHPRRFEPDPAGVHEAGLDPNTPYFVVQWDEVPGADSPGPAARRGLVTYLSTYGTVHAIGHGATHGTGDEWSHSTRDDDTASTGVGSRIEPTHPSIHDVLAFADLYVGTCPVRATEAALLGTPTVRTRPPGTTDPQRLVDFESAGLLDSFERDRDAVRRVRELVPNPAARSVWRQRRDELVASKVDVATYAATVLRRTADGTDARPDRVVDPVGVGTLQAESPATSNDSERLGPE